MPARRWKRTARSWQRRPIMPWCGPKPLRRRCPAFARERASFAGRWLEAGDEAQAAAFLKDVPRASPFADWKYFVRGLAAYYRQDATEMQANWQRLDAGRFAARIAAPLKALANPGVVAADDPSVADALARLGGQVLGGPILARLQQMQDFLSAGRWREAVKPFRAAVPLLRQTDSALPQRLMMVLYATFVRKGAPEALKELAKVAEPPPMDPHWNRGLAMAWERTKEGDWTDAEDFWRAYLDDLAGLECLAPAERTLAQSLVWLRLGRSLVDESSAVCPDCGVRHDPDEEQQAQAVESFEKSLELAPDLLPAYQGLAEAYQEWDKPEKAAATHRRLVKRFPEHLDSLLFLATHYLKDDDPFTARDFTFRAQRLKPLDPQIKGLVCALHLGSARHHAMSSRWEEGRAELTAAENAGIPPADAPYVLVQRAALEFKAGDWGLANRLLDRAKNELGEWAPILLVMSIESIRYALPKKIAEEFQDRWRVELKKSRRSRAAGEMSRLLYAHVATGLTYPGCEGHVQQLLGFLRRCSRVKWEEHHLRFVLEFLLFWEHHEREREDESPRRFASVDATRLLWDLAAKARSKFPDNAFFQLLAGEMEMRKGPKKSDRQFAQECFQRALQLAQGANVPDSIDVAKRAREKLDALDRTEKLSFEGMPPFPLPFSEEEEDEEDDGAFEDSYDPPDFDGEDDGGNGPLPGFAGKLFRMFERMCRDQGLDPEKIIDQAARDMPFRFRMEDGPRNSRKKRKQRCWSSGFSRQFTEEHLRTSPRTTKIHGKQHHVGSLCDSGAAERLQRGRRAPPLPGAGPPVPAGPRAGALHGDPPGL